MPIRVDPDRVRAIATSCRNTGDAIEQQAQTMNSQMQQLQEALAGFPHVSLEDRFAEWNRLFHQLSDALHESHSFLNSVADRVDRLIADLSQ